MVACPCKMCNGESVSRSKYRKDDKLAQWKAAYKLILPIVHTNTASAGG